jgi:hypothetical protein
MVLPWDRFGRFSIHLSGIDWPRVGFVLRYFSGSKHHDAVK